MQNAEERLAEFSFGDMWSGSLSPAGAGGGSTRPIGSAGPRRIASGTFSSATTGSHTERGRRPPLIDARGGDDGDGEEEKLWLARRVVRALQHDLGALYDYLVDRAVVWDVSEARAGRKWMMVSKSGNRGFEADVQGMPMTDVLIEFDNRLRATRVPHPHPLLLESILP